MTRDGDILRTIGRRANDPTVNLATLLRDCISLGGVTGSETLRNWAALELKGYGSQDEIPDYRVIEAPILMDGLSGHFHFTGQTMTPNMLPDFVREEITTELQLRHPVAEIVAMMARAESGGHLKLSPPAYSQILPLINSKLPYGQHIDSFYWSVSDVPLARILDVVRTNLVELVVELRAAAPAGEVPTGSVAEQAVQYVIYKKGSRPVTNNVVSAGPVAIAGKRASATLNDPSNPAGAGLAAWLGVLAALVAAGAGVWALFIR